MESEVRAIIGESGSNDEEDDEEDDVSEFLLSQPGRLNVKMTKLVKSY